MAEAHGWDVVALHGEDRRGPALYLSAGIHGDEPASTDGLVEWAEESIEFLRVWPVLICPCLNPWGLVQNSRLDGAGRDLNRSYNAKGIPTVDAHKRLLLGRRFALALAMHEDYDARGAYIYEIIGERPFIGERLIEAASAHVGRDPRSRIEGSACRNGLIRRRIREGTLEGHPEAFFLHFHCARRVLTLETPSEMDIGRRVAAQVAVLHEAVRWLVEAR
jgi:predicted deacylase